MSFIHYTQVGHFNSATVSSSNLAVARPIDPERIARLLAEYPPGMAEFVRVQDGYARCRWAPAGGLTKEVIEFAYRLAREEGCLAVENGRSVEYPPEAVRVQGELWERASGQAGLAAGLEQQARERAAAFERRRPMNEAAWLTSANPGQMVAHLLGRGSDRKLRLFGCACFRRIWDLSDDPWSRSAVAAAERVADSATAADRLDLARHRMRPAASSQASSLLRAFALAAAAVVAEDAGTAAVEASRWARYARRCQPAPPDDGPEEAAQAEFLRDLFGNPFRPPPVFDPGWRTSQVVALARGAYELSAFDQLPILADALEDAGCADEQLLDHGRGPATHVRGCWLVDLILAKK